MASAASHYFKFCFVSLSLVLLLFSARAHAESPSEMKATSAPSWQAQNAAMLDQLFVQLKNAADGNEAERFANLIDARFRQSGSDTLDLVLGRAREAMSKGDMPVAIEILSRIIDLAPDWAEAWNVRATAFFMMGDHERAKSDAIETLAREPRHIGAMTGLALIFEMQGRQKEALRAYRQVLGLGPHLKPIQSAVARLAGEIEQPM